MNLSENFIELVTRAAFFNLWILLLLIALPKPRYSPSIARSTSSEKRLISSSKNSMADKQGHQVHRCNMIKGKMAVEIVFHYFIDPGDLL